MFPYLREAQGEEYDILASDEYIEKHRPYYTENPDDCYVEFKSLIGLTSLALLPLEGCIIHAVAIRIEDMCWLVSAPSGTGKTTQYYNLKRLYGEKIQMVCGDMPMLKTIEDGSIIVHPSPWKGKERIKGSRPTPLGGILFLKQGEENTIRKLEPEEAVLPLLLQLAVLPDTEEQVLQMTAFAEKLLQRYPVWEMVNRGDSTSSRLAAETFHAYMKRQDHEI